MGQFQSLLWGAEVELQLGVHQRAQPQPAAAHFPSRAKCPDISELTRFAPGTERAVAFETPTCLTQSERMEFAVRTQNQSCSSHHAAAVVVDVGVGVVAGVGMAGVGVGYAG